MVIKEGYKQTEIGVIPMDWEVKKIGEVLKVIGGGAFKSTENSRIGIKWLKIANVGINQAVWNEENYLPFDLVKENQNFLLHEGDYVIALTRPILDKKLKITKLTKNDVPALLNQRVGKIEVEKDNDNDFAYFLFQKSGTINALLQSMAGTDPPNLSNKGIYNIDCALPPTFAEQTAIATALSDVDGLITGLEKLIAKKRNIKQGAMQQLLQPKEGWEVKKLVEMTKILTKQTGFDYTAYIKPSLVKNKTDDTLPFIQNKDFNNKWINLNTDYFIPKSVAFQFPNILLNEKSLLISISGSVGNVGVFESTDLAFIGGAVAIAKFKENTMIDWVMLYLKSQEGQKKLLDNVKAGSHQNLILDDIRKIEISFPTKEEQIRIAKILFDMDAELSALEQKLEKYKKVKLGMMQELLTGKTRLV